MAAQFIGLQMLVTLRDPPTRLKGTVSAVDAGLSLTLSNVWLLDTNRWEPRVTIPSANIADLAEFSAAQNAAAPQQPITLPQAIPAQDPPRPKAGFQDPAILSMGTKPAALPKAALETQPQPNTSEKRDPQPVGIPSVQVKSPSRDTTPTGLATGSMARLKVEESADEDLAQQAAYQDAQASGQKKRNRRKEKKPIQARNKQQEDPEASPQSPANATGKGKGWRETPMLQSTSSFQPFKSLKKNGKGRQNDNGWASEDVTDVQELGDFDFEGELAKFDKQNLFEQMRKDDVVDEADRLVSHNRQAGPKNLHYSENVLDVPPTMLKAGKDKGSKEPPNDFWNSEADDAAINGGERLSGREHGSRQGSRRGESKVSTTRRSQSRKASAAAGGPGPNRVNSGVSHYPAQSVRGSRPNSRLSANLVDKKKQLPTASAQGFYLLPSNRRLETVSALQMLNLENIAHNEIGLTEDMMTENAGRGLAEVTMTALTDPAIKVRHAGTGDPSSGSTPPPTVVVLVGNNKSGIRAVAAARHLRNKGINTLVCVVGLERGERDLLEDLRQQVRLYRNLGGRVFSKIDLFDHLRKLSIPTLTIDTPRTSTLSSLAAPAAVTLIVDALLGLAISFEELRTGDQATVYELIEWANRNEAFVLAVDVPTGIDPSSGRVSVIDGSRLYVQPRYVVAMGCPKRGLLEAMAASAGGTRGSGGGAGGDDGEAVLGAVTAREAALPADDDAVAEWKLFVVDMGLGAAVWKKAGTKIRRGIDFDDKWVLQMKYQGAAVGGDDADA